MNEAVNIACVLAMEVASLQSVEASLADLVVRMEWFERHLRVDIDRFFRKTGVTIQSGHSTSEGFLNLLEEFLSGITQDGGLSSASWNPGAPGVGCKAALISPCPPDR